MEEFHLSSAEQPSLMKSGDTQNLKILFATWAYSGYCPVAPAAVASMAALLGVIVLRESWLMRDGFPVVIAAVGAIGFRVSGAVETLFGEKDCHRIVIDDVLGVLISIYGFQQGKVDVLLGLWAMFRVIDNSKIFPLWLIESRLKGSAGIMLDDVVAGLYTNLAFRLVLAILPA